MNFFVHLLRYTLRTRYTLLLKIVLLGSSLHFLAACSEDACSKLADLICSCKSGASAKQYCNEHVRNAKISKGKLSAEELRTCDNLLKTCNCSRLEARDLVACGLALEN